MADKNKTLLGFGLSLLIISFLCAAGVLYFMGNTNQKNAQQIASLEVQLMNLISEKGQEKLPSRDAKRVHRKEVDEAEFLAKAETIYGPGELERKEGVLWIDRETMQCIITLGAVNGLQKGSRLNIYHNDVQIGKVNVEVPFDIISYVRLIDQDFDDFNDDYYRVALNE